MHSTPFDDYPIKTYSHLVEWLENMALNRASADQWLATLQAAKNIREEEIEYAGLHYFLEDDFNSPSITKSALLAIAEENLGKCQIVLQTERIAVYTPSLQIAPIPIEAIPSSLLDAFVGNELIGRYELSSFAYRIIGLHFPDMFGGGVGYYVFDEKWRQFIPHQIYKSRIEALDFLYEIASQKFNRYVSTGNQSHYEDYALLGNKRHYAEWLVSLPQWPFCFDDAHFNLDNILLHLRTAEWTDHAGQPFILVDELQSDWHALGRAHGYFFVDTEGRQFVPIPEDGEVLDSDASVPDAPFKKEWHELGIKIALWLAIRSGCNRLGFTSSRTHTERYGFEVEKLSLLYDQQIPQALNKLAKKYYCTIDAISIQIKQPKDSLSRRNHRWEIHRRETRQRSKSLKHKAVAMRYLQIHAEEREAPIKVLNISPALINTVKQKGIPLFGWW